MTLVDSGAPVEKVMVPTSYPPGKPSPRHGSDVPPIIQQNFEGLTRGGVRGALELTGWGRVSEGKNHQFFRAEHRGYSVSYYDIIF